MREPRDKLKGIHNVKVVTGKGGEGEEWDLSEFVFYPLYYSQYRNIVSVNG